jgi:hypothetical protein
VCCANNCPKALRNRQRCKRALITYVTPFPLLGALQHPVHPVALFTTLKFPLKLCSVHDREASGRCPRRAAAPLKEQVVTSE